MKRYFAPSESILHQLRGQYMGYQDIMDEYHVCRSTAFNYLAAVPAAMKVVIIPHQGKPYALALRHAVGEAYRHARMQLSPYTRD